MRSLSSPNDISVLRSLASPIKCRSSTLVNKIIGWKSSSYWLSTVGNWMKISLRDFTWSDVYSLCAHCSVIVPLMIRIPTWSTKAPETSLLGWMWGGRLENSSRTRKFSSRLCEGRERTCEKIILSIGLLEIGLSSRLRMFLSLSSDCISAGSNGKWTCVEEEAKI